jgi:hypothetical protein
VLCPGADWSRYECSTCGRFVPPWATDDGELVCPYCDATGLVILDLETLDHLERVREFAAAMGLRSQLEHQLTWLHNYGYHDDGPRKRQCMLSKDFAPHSFCFGHYALPLFSTTGKRAMWFNGGLIYQGPGQPADGSFPSLIVSLDRHTGWFCHT